MKLDLHDAEGLNARLEQVLVQDKERFDFPEYFARWLFGERLDARGARKEMGFNAYEGPAHIGKFFGWHTNANFADYLPEDQAGALAATSAEIDTKLFEAYGLPTNLPLIAKLGRYNAQDHMLMRSYPVPERNRVRTLLDFGAGHARLANLGFNDPDETRRITTYIAMEAIPSTYFTQLAYLKGLGLRIWEYLDHCDQDLTQADLQAAIESHDVIHIPTWRHDLLPDGCVDMVSCVQVLKELPGPLVNALMPIFSRVTQKTGAIYIRDHQQFHNPNHMPIPQLLQANGFTLEFAPQIVDRVELHGDPRIWRKVDPAHFVSEQHNG
ncbi:hypothetical protein [Roseovarius sp. 2305UL8-3]|uniref:hypothetical protein n=1 Tax=Roseovarius conchicola TaxID=3121636 RepID=UPI00352889CD